MREVLSTMWCEEDDDSEGEEGNFGSASLVRELLLTWYAPRLFFFSKYLNFFFS